MYDNFCVRIALKFDAFCAKLILEGQVIFNNAIVNHDNFARFTNMWVSVASTGLTVRCPASMPDSDMAFYRIFVQQLAKSIELACVSPYLDATILNDSQASRVIPTVLESLQAVIDNRRCIARTDVTDDATHRLPPLFRSVR